MSKNPEKSLKIATGEDIGENAGARPSYEFLRKSEERYRALYHSAHDAIMVLEPPDWTFTAANPATVALFRTRDEKDFTARPRPIKKACPWHRAVFGSS